MDVGWILNQIKMAKDGLTSGDSVKAENHLSIALKFVKGEGFYCGACGTPLAETICQKCEENGRLFTFVEWLKSKREICQTRISSIG